MLEELEEAELDELEEVGELEELEVVVPGALVALDVELDGDEEELVVLGLDEVVVGVPVEVEEIGVLDDVVVVLLPGEEITNKPATRRTSTTPAATATYLWFNLDRMAFPVDLSSRNNIII